MGYDLVGLTRIARTLGVTHRVRSALLFAPQKDLSTPPAMYHATSAETGRRLAKQLIGVLHTCPVPELARLGGRCGSGGPKSWPTSSPAASTTGGTEAINVVIEKTRRLAHGFRNFKNYRLRILLAADGTRPYRTRPTHA